MKQIAFLISLFSPFIIISQDLRFDELSLESSLSQPVEITNSGIAGDDRLFIGEKTGQIRIIKDLESAPFLAADPFLQITVDNRSEGGLLGIAFDPDYENNGYFYVNYTFRTGDNMNTRISRFQVDNTNPDTTLAGSELSLLEIPQPYNNHNGGDLAFGNDGFLYIPMGDGGSGGDPENSGQDSTTLLGSVLRIDVSLPLNSTAPFYKIPGDNPWVGDASVPDEVWSIGWRNPWRFSFDMATGDMWVADVGQGAREEINRIPAGTPGGLNYGWHCYEGTLLYNDSDSDCPDYEDTAQPLMDYARDLGKSVTGGYVYRGSDYPSLIGKYVFTDYVTSSNFWVISMNGNTPSIDLQGFSGGDALDGVTVIGEDINGELYTAEISGSISKIAVEGTVPVELNSFAAETTNDGILLTWITSSEINSDYFSIERGSDTESFIEIGQLSAQGNSSVENTYTYLDTEPESNPSYYRLRIVDLDGSEQLSPIVEVNTSSLKDNRHSEIVHISPNPNYGVFKIITDEEKIDYRIYSLSGKEILTGSGRNQSLINISDQVQGVYLINIKVAGRSYFQKFIIM